MSTSNSIMIGIVKSLNDPEGLGRVQVRFPHLGDVDSNWCRLATPMAGKDRGMFFRPEPEDEVLVAFEHGDPRRPYVLGSLWGSTDKPPKDDGQTQKNNWRFIRSRSGHLIKLDDTSGSERIEIVANDQKRKIVIDTSGDKIEITCDAGDITIKAGKKISLEAKTVEIKAQQQMQIQAGAAMTIKGQTVSIN